jgi:23S rRNA (uridine2552-2'-O)-methyltransferase
MKRNKSWLHRQQKDPYVKTAKKQNYRSRAVYKLQEIDVKDRLFQPGMFVLDLGAAPGGWCQYAAKKIKPGGKVIAIDRLQMEAISGVEFILGDILDTETIKHCLSLTDDKAFDLVISDIAPDLTGIRDTDEARIEELAISVIETTSRVIKSGGDLLIKTFEGSLSGTLKSELSSKFQKVTVRKPKASRDSSREFYMLARGYGI